MYKSARLHELCKIEKLSQSITVKFFLVNNLMQGKEILLEDVAVLCISRKISSNFRCSNIEIV